MENYYNVYVPNIYVPEPSVMGEILSVLELNTAVQYLPKLWSDMIIFDHTDRENLLNAVLDIMMNHQGLDNENETKFKEQFAKIAWNIWEKIENQDPNRVQKLV